MKLTYETTTEDTATVATFFFAPEQQLSYTAGQFVEVTIPHDNADNRGTKRWFTLSSSPTDDKISITTKFATENGSTFKQALRSLVSGDVITISDPMGDFVLPKLVQTPLVFIAGGIGVTPFLSIFQWLKATNEERPIKFLLAVANEDEIGFQDIFESAKQHATIVVSQPSPAWGGERGHLSAEMILGLEQPTDDTFVYISGPESLVENLTHDLIKAGLNKHQVVGDYFPNYPAE